MKKKTKNFLIISGSLLVLILITTFLFCNYSRMGYMMTIELHGFTNIEDNVYLDNKYTGNSTELLEAIDKANERVLDFWGTVISKPAIIISSDTKKLNKLGYIGSPSTTSYVFNGALNYIVLSPSVFNIDILAHELTHAELYSRVYKGKWYNSELIPVWFNEGIAMQNDFRDKYNEDAWKDITDNGKNVKDINSIASASEFYNNDRLANYIISKHTISEWISENGINELIIIIQKVNGGENFKDLYFK